MAITVYITTYQIPFDQVIQAIESFNTPEQAKDFVNQQSLKWWCDHEGDRSVAECNSDPYEAIDEIGYNNARYELWGGECCFHAMIDAKTYAELHEAHYKRECDDKGLQRPGYLVNAYADGAKPGGCTQSEQADYQAKSNEGQLEVHDYFTKVRH